MQFLAINERNTVDFDAADFTSEVVGPEVQRVRELYGESFVRQIWHRADVPGGCLLVEAEDEAAARAGLESLPLVHAGMVKIVALIPLKPFAGFAM